MKRDQAHADLSHKSHKNLLQAHLSCLVKKVNKIHYHEKHVTAHKAATLTMKMQKSATGKHGMGIHSVVF